MAVGRISGPLLKNNLIRNGIDLAFETDLLYLDVNNQRIGVKNAAPQYELDVIGTTRTTSLTVDTEADIAQINIVGNTISTQNSFLNLGTLDTVVYQNRARVDSIDIEGNVISTNSSNANLELRPNGTGTVEVLSSMNVDGNIHATGNITADGNITIGDADTDNVIFNAEIASDIIPDANNTYKLGTNAKQWADVWVNQLNTSSLSTSVLVVDGIDMALRQGNIYYVAENGDDSKSGTHQQDPFATIKFALSQATAGDTVHIYPGVYEEEFPLTIPVGVSLHGHGIRSVTIQPTDATKFNNAVLLNGEVTVENITIKGFYSSSTTESTLAYTLNNPNAYSTSASDNFGYSVATSDNYAIVGAYLEDDASGANSGKVYIFDVTTGALLHTLDNPNAYSTSVSDYFGYSVAVSGNYAIVGAYREGDAGGTLSGKAYIFDVTTGSLLYTLDNPNAYSTSSNDQFGWRVATTDTHAIVGAYSEDDAGGADSGKAYIYEYEKIFNFSDVTSINITQIEVRGDLNFGSPNEAINLRLAGEASYNVYTGTNDGSVWELANGNGTWLGPQPSGTALNIEFLLGTSINFAPSGMTNWWEVKLTVEFTRNGKTDVTKELVFGAPNRNAGTVNSDGSGSILYNINQYAFVLDNPNAYSTSTSDYFGSDVDISGNYAIVGAYLEDTVGANNSGKAYIFDVTTGALLHTLDNPNAYSTSSNDYFGYSVAIDGDRAIVGAYQEDDAGGASSGKAYIFNVTTGALLHTLDNPNAYSTSDSDYFGFDVDISGDKAIVGAYLEDEAGGSSSGKAYIFDVISGQLQSTLDNPTAFGTSLNDRFGYSVAISGNYAIVGAYGEDDAGGVDSGKSYIYELGTTVEDGYAFRYADGATVSTRSPYIKNVTVITEGTTVALGNNSADDPRGFNAGNAGKGVLLDGGVLAQGSKEASMLFHAATFITPGVDAVRITNGGRIEWLNSFTYFADRSFYAYDSAQGKYGDGKTRVRLSGVTGTFASGDTVTFTSTDASTVYTKVIEGIDDDVLLIDGKDVDLLGFDKTPQSISSSSGGTATAIENVDVRDFGAEVRMIGSASIYGNFGLVGDGEGVLMYAIGHNLAYIGNGKEVTNDPTTVIQENEVVESNGAKIRYNSVDHKGDFRVGDLFYVNQDDGTVSFVASALNIDLTTGATFTTGGNTTFVSGERIDTGNLRISGNTIESLSGAINFSSASDNINLQNNVNITGDLDVTGDVSIGGNITIGDQASDSLNIVAGINSDLIPATTSTYELGNSTNTWSNIYVDDAQIDDILITDNFITTTASNADLDLRANGTGEVLIPDNDVQIDNNLNVDGTTTLANTNIVGTVTHIGNTTQTGNTTVTGNVTVTQDLDVSGSAQFEEILVDDNYITTTTSNADLELRANGTGNIIVPNNNVTFSQDLTVSQTINVRNISASGTISTNDYNISDIHIDDNYIETTVSNADLELRANGSGRIYIPSNDVLIDNDLTVTGNVTVGNDLTISGDFSADDITITGTATANEFSTGDIKIFQNVITTTNSNSNLELRANGTGNIVAESFEFDDNTIRTPGDFILEPGSEYVKVNTTGAIRVPVGTQLERPTPEAGQIRFNSDTNVFEGFDGTNWIQLHGVIDLDRDTSVTAEATPGANDNTIRFNVAGNTVADITSARLRSNQVVVDNITINGNRINSATDTNLNLSANGTGSIVLENFVIKDNNITNIVTDAVTTFENTTNGYVKFDGTYGMVIPVGGNANRPPIAFTEIGQMRWNTDAARTEIWDGSNWVSVAGTSSGISRREAEDLALEIVLTLG